MRRTKRFIQLGVTISKELSVIISDTTHKSRIKGE